MNDPSFILNAPDVPPRGFLPFTLLRIRLESNHSNLIGLLIGAFCLVSLATVLPIGWLIGRLLNIPMNAPVIDHPNGGWFLPLLFTSMLVSLSICYLLSFVVLAVILRLFYKWKPERVRALVFESRVPAHWLARDEEL